MTKTVKLFLKQYLLLTALALALAGCGVGNSNAKLIASYPKQPGEETGWEAPSGRALPFHRSQFKLQVRSVPRTIDRIENLAQRYDGYVAQVDTWQQRQQDFATIEAVVPSSQQAELEAKLVSLGDLLSETHWDEEPGTHHPNEYWPSYSTITIHLESPSPVFSSTRSLGWHPSTTFWNAFDVAAAIFTFLIDVLIWLLVVVGPFVAIGWGVRLALQKYIPRRKED